MSIRSLLILTYSIALLSVYSTYTYKAEYIRSKRGTDPVTVNPSSNNYKFKDENVTIFDTNKVNEFIVKAKDKTVFLSMISQGQSNKTTLTAVDTGNPMIKLKAGLAKYIGIKIMNETIIKNKNNNLFKVVKPEYSGSVQWILFGNQKVSFVPKGNVNNHNISHIVEGNFTDQDITFSDICLVKGIVNIYAIDENVAIQVENNTVFTNANGGINILVLHAAEGRTINFNMDKRVDFQAKYNVPFSVIQTGSGKVNFNIINHTN